MASPSFRFYPDPPEFARMVTEAIDKQDAGQLIVTMAERDRQLEDYLSRFVVIEEGTVESVDTGAGTATVLDMDERPIEDVRIAWGGGSVVAGETVFFDRQRNVIVGRIAEEVPETITYEWFGFGTFGDFGPETSTSAGAMFGLDDAVLYEAGMKLADDGLLSYVLGVPLFEDDGIMPVFGVKSFSASLSRQADDSYVSTGVGIRVGSGEVFVWGEVNPYGGGVIEPNAVAVSGLTGLDSGPTCGCLTITGQYLADDALGAENRFMVWGGVDGELWSWGWNKAGCGGAGTFDGTNTPQLVMDGVVFADGHSAHSAAIMSDGTCRMWGANYAGELGIPSVVGETHVPTDVGLADVVDVACGHENTLWVLGDGTVWAAGVTAFGSSGTPYEVTSVSNVVAVASGRAPEGVALEQAQWVLTAEGQVLRITDDVPELVWELPDYDADFGPAVLLANDDHPDNGFRGVVWARVLPAP